MKSTEMPKAGGHVKPGQMAKHAPDGYEHMKDCPMCKGKGIVPAEQHGSLRDMMVKGIRKR